VAPSLTIVGLGPGDASLLTYEASDALAGANEVWLRTARHPAVAALPPGPAYRSFDSVYEEATSFDDVYRRITDAVWERARGPAGVVYAVPGHPLFGEATVQVLLARAGEASIGVRIVPGLSFLDASCALLGLDPLAEGLLLLDALALDPRGRGLIPQRPVLIGQVHGARAASLAKLALLEAYPAEHTVQIVSRAGTVEARRTDAPLSELDHDPSLFDHLTSIYVPAVAPEQDVRSFEGLRRVVARLRAPEGGCPWDLKQTHASLKRYLIEEAYEALEALDEGDPHRMAEEFGDLMMQVLLHAQIAEDEGAFAIEDVIAGIASKLIRRHPHVFGDAVVADAEEVLQNWEALKQDERGDQPVLAAVPASLPALAQAQSVQGRAEKAGIAPPRDRAAAMRALGPGSIELDAAGLGEALFSIAGLARERGIDAEEALRSAIGRYRAEATARERAADASPPGERRY